MHKRNVETAKTDRRALERMSQGKEGGEGEEEETKEVISEGVTMIENIVNSSEGVCS